MNAISNEFDSVVESLRQRSTQDLIHWSKLSDTIDAVRKMEPTSELLACIRASIFKDLQNFVAATLLLAVLSSRDPEWDDVVDHILHDPERRFVEYFTPTLNDFHIQLSVPADAPLYEKKMAEDFNEACWTRDYSRMLTFMESVRPEFFRVDVRFISFVLGYTVMNDFDGFVASMDKRDNLIDINSILEMLPHEDRVRLARMTNNPLVLFEIMRIVSQKIIPLDEFETCCVAFFRTHVDAWPGFISIFLTHPSRYERILPSLGRIVAILGEEYYDHPLQQFPKDTALMPLFGRLFDGYLEISLSNEMKGSIRFAEASFLQWQEYFAADQHNPYGPSLSLTSLVPAVVYHFYHANPRDVQIFVRHHCDALKNIRLRWFQNSGDFLKAIEGHLAQISVPLEIFAENEIPFVNETMHWLAEEFFNAYEFALMEPQKKLLNSYLQRTKKEP